MTADVTSEYRVADRNLAGPGRREIEWAESRMPVLGVLRKRFASERPFAGQHIAGCVHLTKETAVLVRTLAAAGATVSWTGGNQLTTQDSVAAALVDEGVRVFSWRGMTKDELQWAIDQTLTCYGTWPTLIVDDGADMISTVHSKFPAAAAAIIGATDKTTSGVQRLRALATDGGLRFPVLGVNDVVTKWVYDNTYGTGQSVVDGILRASNILLAGKVVVVAGFGHVGRGVAIRARGLGAQVIVTCVHATTGLKALTEGFRVMPMSRAAPLGDLFCTVTGMAFILTGSHFDAMKDGAFVCNGGHSDTEIDVDALRERAMVAKPVRREVTEYTLGDGRRIYLLSDGGLVNLAAAEGNPSEVMDLSFANQALGLVGLVRNREAMDNLVYDLPDEQDQEIARLKLDVMGVRIDSWTKEQSEYALGFADGT